MTDISRFGFAIDSTQVVSAYQNLDRMADSSRQMEARALRMEKATQDMTRRLTELVREQEAYNRHNQMAQSSAAQTIDANDRVAQSYARISAEVLALNQAMTASAEADLHSRDQSRFWELLSRSIFEAGGAIRFAAERADEFWGSMTGRDARAATDSMQSVMNQTERMSQFLDVTARQMRTYDEAVAGLSTSSQDLAGLIEHIGSQSEGTALQVERLRENLKSLGLDMDVITDNDDIAMINAIGGRINEVNDVRERNRIARELGFSPEILADTRVGLRQIGEEQQRLFAMQEATARMQRRWEEEQTARQRRRLEILKEIEAQENQSAQARHDAMVRMGHAWTELVQGAEDPTLNFFGRVTGFFDGFGTRLRNMGLSIRNYFQAVFDSEGYAEDMLNRGDLDDPGERPTLAADLSRQAEAFRDQMRQPEMRFDFEGQTEAQRSFLEERLEILRNSGEAEVELIRQIEDQLYQVETRSLQMRKNNIEQMFNFRMTTALTALEREQMALKQYEMMAGNPGLYSPADLEAAGMRNEILTRQRVNEDRQYEIMEMRSRAGRSISGLRAREAATNRAVQAGAAPRVAATGAAMEVAEARFWMDMDVAQRRRQHTMEQMQIDEIDPESDVGQRRLQRHDEEIANLRADYEATRQIISMQAGLNADIQQYQEERRALLTKDALLWAEHPPQRRQLQERLAQADMEIAEEYGRGTEAYAAAYAEREAVIRQSAQDQSELGLRTMVADIERDLESQEGLADAYAQGANAVREFNIARQVSLQAAALAASGHDLESESIQELLDQYRDALELSERYAAQQMFAQTMNARDLEISAVRYERGQSGSLPMERRREVEMYRERQRLENMGLEEEDVQRGLDQYGELLNEQSLRDFETSQADRLVNSARNAAQQIETTLSQGLVNAAVHGADSFEGFFESIGQMAHRTAAEIARVMVIQPMIGGAMNMMGLGNIAAELGYAAFTMHSGGTAGSDGAMRMVPRSAVAGAYRYHQGTGSAGGPSTGLAPNEVLTILERGERVTPVNAESGGNLSVTNNITVDGGGSGGEEGAAELARSIAHQIDVHLEQKMAKFAIRQQRVGGVLRNF